MRLLNYHASLICIVLLFQLVGCEAEKSQTKEKRPRPVESALLTMEAPPARGLVSAVVASWKTEKVGAEVAGSIDWIVENNTEIQGRIRDDQGNVIVKGTPIAGLDQEKYILQLEAAAADIARAKNAIEAVAIEIEEGIPSKIRAAEASHKRAKQELDRSLILIKKGAASGSDLSRDESNFAQAEEGLKQLSSLLSAKKTDLESRRSNLSKAEKAMRAAERDVEDCTLYASFSGQISRVLAVPKSVVGAGYPVAVLQMMDPIKVELEVSPEDSRLLQDRQRLGVIVKKPDGSKVELDGLLQQVDGVADPKERTFTVTILVANKRSVDGQSTESAQLPQLAQLDSAMMATTDQTWRFNFQFFGGAEDGKHYAPIDTIHSDAEGKFVWRVTNVTVHDPLPEDRTLQVEKMRINTLGSNLSFLGNWVLSEVEFLDATFDPELGLIAGKLQVASGEPDDWVGSEIVVKKSKGQWLLRPGDIVQVDLGKTNPTAGVFVPMDAIAQKDGKHTLFLVDESSSKTVVQQTEVKINDKDAHLSSLIQIEASDPNVSLVGKRYVIKGTHYLRDEQPVRLVSPENGE